MIGKVVISVLFLALLLGCSEQETTGAAITSSLLKVIAVDENGKNLGDVDVYVNGVLKGATSAYGENKGSKLLILPPGSNSIFVEKKGYISPPATSMSAAQGEQHLLLPLKIERSGYTVMITDEQGNPLSEADVTLYQVEDEPLRWTLSDNQGKAFFPMVDDGTYHIKISKDKYQKVIWTETINIKQGRSMVIEKRLPRLPYLHIIITDSEGKALSGAEVTIYRKQEYNTPGKKPLVILHTDRQGLVEWQNVALGTSWAVIVKKGGYEAQIAEKEILDGDYSLAVSLPPGEE